MCVNHALRKILGGGSLARYIISLLFLMSTRFALGEGFTILPIARFGDPAPDIGQFYNIRSLSFNDKGQIAFAAVTGTQNGLFMYDQGKIRTVVHQGDPAPGGGDFLVFGYTWMNQQGQIAFSVTLSTGQDGVFLFDGNAIHAVARSGEAAPGCGPFGVLVLPWLSNQGQVVFTGRVSGRYGTFLYDGEQLTTIACPGDQAPQGGTFTRTLRPSLNDRGQVVFEGQVSAPARGGIFLYEGGKLWSMLRGGDPAPEGDTFSSLYTPIVNASGQVAFVGYWGEFAQSHAAFLFDGGKIHRLMPPADPDTGEEVGVADPSGDRPHPFYFNDLGQTAFVGGRRFPDEPSFRSGLFYFDGEVFKTILFAGDPVPGSQGDRFSTVFSVYLNNVGQIAFVAAGPRLGSSSLFLAIPDK